MGTKSAVGQTWMKRPTQDEEHYFPSDRFHRVAALKEANQVEIQATYFPAFRTMIEAWSSMDRSDSLFRHFLESRRRTQRRVMPGRRIRPTFASTELARTVFGNFVPSINYPSPREIEQQIDLAIQRAVNRLAAEDRSLLSNAFTGVFGAISQDSGLGHTGRPYGRSHQVQYQHSTEEPTIRSESVRATCKPLCL